MSHLLELLGIAAVDKVAQHQNNEIKFDNFVAQANQQQILVKTKSCDTKKSGWFSNDIKDDYLELYNYLVKADVISKQMTKASFITWDSVHTVNPAAITSLSVLKQKMLAKKSEYPKELSSCYRIDYQKLWSLLKNYKFSATDEVKMFTGGNPQYIYYTGIGAKKSGKHTVKEFMQIMNKHFEVDCMEYTKKTRRCRPAEYIQFSGARSSDPLSVSKSNI
jgi:hypothetical protein